MALKGPPAPDEPQFVQKARGNSETLMRVSGICRLAWKKLGGFKDMPKQDSTFDYPIDLNPGVVVLQSETLGLSLPWGSQTVEPCAKVSLSGP